MRQLVAAAVDMGQTVHQAALLVDRQLKYELCSRRPEHGGGYKSEVILSLPELQLRAPQEAPIIPAIKPEEYDDTQVRIQERTCRLHKRRPGRILGAESLA
jgi:hypothetical protein